MHKLTSFLPAVALALLAATTSAFGTGQGELCVHISNAYFGPDTIVIGDTNTLEIWVANDAILEGMSPALEISFGVDLEWIMDGPDPEVTLHNRALGGGPDGSCWNLSGLILVHNFDAVSADSIDFGGVAALGGGMLAGASELCYSLRFVVPSNVSEADTGMCVDPIFYPPANTWTFLDASTYPPDFCGQSIASEAAPVADPACFPAARAWICGDADGNSMTTIGDAVFLINYIYGGDPAPDPYPAGDADGCGDVNIADALYLVTWIFGGGGGPCPPVPECEQPTGNNSVSLDCPVEFVAPSADSVVDVPVYLTNETPISGFSLGFHYVATGTEIDSVSTVGSIIPSGALATFDTDVNTASNTIIAGWLDFTTFNEIPVTTDGLLFTLKLSVPGGAPSQSIDIDSAFIAPEGEFILTPSSGGWLTPRYSDCGTGDVVITAGIVCGDANNNGSPDIGDAVSIITFLFSGGPDPGPAGEADGYELVNLHDAAHIIAGIFCGGPAPICPATEPPCKGITNTDYRFRYSSVFPASASSASIEVYLDHESPVHGVTLPVTVRVDGRVPTIDSVAVDGITGQAYGGSQIDPPGSPVAATVNIYSLGLCTSAAPDCYHFATIWISMPPEPENRVITLDLTELPPQQSGQYVNYPQVLDDNLDCWAPVLSGDANPGCGAFDCSYSYHDLVFVTCPGGDAAFRVFVRDALDAPIVGFEDIWIELSGCDQLELCPGESVDVILQPFGPSDDQGIVRFALPAGYCDGDCEATIVTSSCEIGTVPVKSVDRNGDLGVGLSQDFDFSSCNDYNGNGEVDFGDQDIFSQHIGHFCGLSPCERFSYDFNLDPPSDLSPGQHVDLNLIVTNNNFDYCDIGFVSFYASGFGTGQSEELIETISYNDDLRPGQQDTISASYVVPGSGHGCLTARFSTDCCSTAVELTQCAYSYWHCTGDSSNCYEFVIFMNDLPVDSLIRIEHLPGPGWQLIELHGPAGFPLNSSDSLKYQVCTPDSAGLGDTATAYVYIYSNGDPIPDQFENRVVITSQTGDADGNCIVNISDVVYLIAYIFGGGPAPLPYQAGDVDCNDIVNISDAVYLIAYIFGGGPPPCVLDNSGIFHPLF